MISSEMRRNIESTAQEFWSREIKTKLYDTLAQGKEIGHRLADAVDDKTTGLLAVKYTAMYQRSKNGTKVPRSMGDIWLHQSSIFHPINVKTSVTGDNGQPNMVSLKKLLDALLTYKIDSYYLLIVKVSLAGNVRSARVHFVDMLDYLNFVTFDSGPGQIMLKAKSFFEFRETGKQPKKLPLKKKVLSLIALLEDGERRLIINRKRVLGQFRKKAGMYDSARHIVTPETQASFNLQ